MSSDYDVHIFILRVIQFYIVIWQKVSWFFQRCYVSSGLLFNFPQVFVAGYSNLQVFLSGQNVFFFLFLGSVIKNIVFFSNYQYQNLKDLIKWTFYSLLNENLSIDIDNFDKLDWITISLLTLKILTGRYKQADLIREFICNTKWKQLN